MRVRRRVPRDRRRGDGRRDEYTGEANIETQRGEHTGRRTRQLPGTNGEHIDRPVGCGGLRRRNDTGRFLRCYSRDDNPVLGALILRAKARSAYRTFCVT